MTASYPRLASPQGQKWDPPTPTPYRAPETGLISYLPSFLIPYAELMRLHKPAGYYAFYIPHLIGTLYASTLLSPPPSPLILLHKNILFITGTFFLRGAACTWNDTLDADYDRQVARCRNRPVARGAVSPSTAHLFTTLQTAIGVAILVQLDPACRRPALLLTATMAIYPLCKRITNYPQVLLGFSLALGQLVGAAGMGFDLTQQQPTSVLAGIGCMYFANVLNAVVYDAVYAHQDVKDDIKAGVRSVAVAWRENTKAIISPLSAAEALLLGLAGLYLDFGEMYYIGAVAGTAAVLGTMICFVRLDIPESCCKWFKWTIWGTGGMVAGGLGAEYLRRL